MEGRKCSNTTLLIEAIARLNEARARLEWAKAIGANNYICVPDVKVKMAREALEREMREVEKRRSLLRIRQ